MKKIVNYVKNLPIGVRIILKINIVVYLLCFLSDFLFSYDLLSPLAIHATNDGSFRIYQFITNMFTHDLFFDHILFNMVFFIIFSVSVENKIGTRNFVILYLISGIVGSIFCDFTLRENYSRFILEYQNLKPTNYIDSLEYKIRLDDNLFYNKSYGASGSIFGIMISYFLINVLNWRKTLFNILILFLVFDTIVMFNIEKYCLSTYVNHIGGIIGGLLLGITFLIMSNKKWGRNSSTPKLSFVK